MLRVGSRDYLLPVALGSAVLPPGCGVSNYINCIFSEISRRLDDPSDKWINWEQAMNDLGFTDEELRP